MRKILEFIGANLFLLVSGAIGAGVMWIGGWVLRNTMDDPNSAGWPYAIVAAVAAVGAWMDAHPWVIAGAVMVGVAAVILTVRKMEK